MVSTIFGLADAAATTRTLAPRTLAFSVGTNPAGTPGSVVTTQGIAVSTWRERRATGTAGTGHVAAHRLELDHNDNYMAVVPAAIALATSAAPVADAAPAKAGVPAAKPAAPPRGRPR